MKTGVFSSTTQEQNFGFHTKRSISEITNIETIARGVGVDARHYLNRRYGRGRWRKMKGEAWIRLKRNGEEFYAELHWFEANGIGRREIKRKFRIERR